MSIRLVAFDRGYGWIKATDGTQHLLMPSFVTPGHPAPGLGGSVTAVELEGYSYLVGETAVKQAGLTLEPSLRDDEHTSQDSRLLALATLALLAGGPGEHAFYIAAGLPQILMASQAEPVKQMLHSIRQVPVAVTRGNRRYTCTVSVLEAMVMPQGLGVAFDYCLGEDGRPRELMVFPFPLDGRRAVSGAEVLHRDLLVLDVGFNTALTYALSGMEPLVRFCRGGFHGMAYAYQQIGQRLRGKDPWAVQELIRSGRLAGPEYEWAYRQLAEQLNRQVANIRHRFDFYLVAGGGGAALYPYLLPEVENRLLVPDPQGANARGYLKAGRTKWAKHLAAAGL